jgi:hypothetical protein
MRIALITSRTGGEVSKKAHFSSSSLYLSIESYHKHSSRNKHQGDWGQKNEGIKRGFYENAKKKSGAKDK